MKKLLFFFLLAGSFLSNKAQVLNTSFCQTNGTVDAVAIDSVNNVVYIGGGFTSVCGSARSHIAALNLTTGALLPWTATIGGGDVSSLYIYNNALYVGGFFTTVNSQSRMHAAKFYLPSGTLSSWAPPVTTGQTVYSFAAKGNKIYMGGIFLLTVSTGQNLCELDTATATPTAWPEANLNGNVTSVAVDGNNLYVAGTYTNIGSSGINYLSRFILGGAPTLDSWDVFADDYVSAVLPRGSNIYIAGNFSFLNGSSRTRLANVDSASGSANSWDPGCNGPALKLLYRKGMIYVVGNTYSVVGGKSHFFLGAVDINTGISSNWDLNLNSSIFDAATTSSQIFVGGAMSSVLGQTRNNFAVACINPIDTISNPPVGPTNVCAGLTGVSYSVAPVAGATTYSWTYTGTGVTINGSTNPVTLDFATNATGGDLYVKATNGCESTNMMMLSISTYPFVANASGQSSMTCGDSTALSVGDNYGGSGTVSYSWTPSGGLNTTVGTTVMSGTKVTKTYTVTATSTEGCVSKDSITVAVAPISITANLYLPNILCSTVDTIYVSNDYPGAGTVTYTWSPSSTLNLSNPTKIVAHPVTTTDYTVTASSTDGCVASPQTVQVFVDPITLTPGANPVPITCGNTTTLSVGDNYPGSGTLTYTWSPASALNNTHIAGPVATLTANTTFTIDISTTDGCISSATQFVNVNPLQVFAVGAYTSTCGNPVTLSTNNNSGNPNLTYSWSPAAGLSSSSSANPQANVGTTTIFTVTMSLPGCSDAVDYDTVKIAAPATPSICEITSDSLSQYNIIYWDKSGYQTTDSFVVYREVITNTYSVIATVPYTALSMYTDTARSIGPANGNPNLGSYRYKLAVKDSCGNMSGLSPYHNTVFFVDNHTGSFGWNLYAVENQTTPVTQFNLLRDDNNTGAWHVIGTVTGNQITLNDPAYATYQSIANWRVDALGFNCTPTARYSNNNTQGSVVKSKSNITNNRQIGVKDNNESPVGIYPNPNNGKFTVEFGDMQGNVSVRVFSLLGEEIFSAQGKENISIDLSAQESGTYLVQISNEQKTLTKRIVKN